MLTVRAFIAVALVIVGACILVQMLRYGIAQTFTGVILGIAMIALGLFRLKQIVAIGRTPR